MIQYAEFKYGWYVTIKDTPFLLLFILFVSLMLSLTFLISESNSFSGYLLFTNHDLIFFLFRSKSLSLEHNLLMHKVWLKTTERLVWFG